MNQRKIREAQKCPIATESDFSRSIKSKFYFQVMGYLFDPFYLLVGKTYFFFIAKQVIRH